MTNILKKKKKEIYKHTGLKKDNEKYDTAIEKEILKQNKKNKIINSK